MYAVNKSTLAIWVTGKDDTLAWGRDSVETLRGNPCFVTYKEAKHYVIQECLNEIAKYTQLMENLK